MKLMHEWFEKVLFPISDLLFYLIFICIGAVLVIITCTILGKVLDKKKNVEIKAPFSERHPKLNIIQGMMLLCIMVAVGITAIYYGLSYLLQGIVILLNKLGEEVSKMDAVVIVALITGTVSIIGVIISSIVAKVYDYRKNRQEYLARKREEPYGEFVEMVYKVQQNSKKEGSYTEEMMIEDLLRFSRKITLWGSPNVVKKWVKFRENGAKPDSGMDNLFLMEEIMNEMRKDLGLKKVKKGNLLAFFVNDIKEVMKKVKK